MTFFFGNGMPTMINYLVVLVCDAEGTENSAAEYFSICNIGSNPIISKTAIIVG